MNQTKRSSGADQGAAASSGADQGAAAPTSDQGEEVTSDKSRPAMRGTTMHGEEPRCGTGTMREGDDRGDEQGGDATTGEEEDEEEDDDQGRGRPATMTTKWRRDDGEEAISVSRG
ncbi:hypothetical protein Syun_006743 [Stephania yunnanensis]|uniref:Uncharacterized protein n=1 Tax=Stephania yunnanensis TaxID=152371 RepID=A0AAP0PXU4_9MAGN